ncbi:hypothetical protein CS022_14055 [Veronia nyctiphanis]|uniref:Uncharacterized protein n=1 Tax=Veronia nyctiphanis TaxID=1278244 RepID=A0A4Q0YRM0_9GAMM|nr:hypothetical protein [Veronia nyctiphanis]RXJ72754.1 hypothetical protein CS022_14055 [Veronia nyctiphanis]
MIRANTLVPYKSWAKPLVSEVATIIYLLKDNGYDAAQLAKVTGLQQKNINVWTARYKNEPDNLSSIPYPCWCFLCALVGKPNIQSNGDVIDVNVKKVLYYFKPTAFRSNDKFICPSQEQFSNLIDNDNYESLTTEKLSTVFNWNASNFAHGVENGSLPFLNWSLILMTLGIDIQKMILKDLEGDVSID